MAELLYVELCAFPCYMLASRAERLAELLSRVGSNFVTDASAAVGADRGFPRCICTLSAGMGSSFDFILRRLACGVTPCTSQGMFVGL